MEPGNKIQIQRQQDGTAIIDMVYGLVDLGG
jgi:hypothetical protein